MKTATKFIEKIYLFIAIVFFINAIRVFNSNTNKAIMFAVFAIMAVFMYFFKRKFRKKWFENNQNK